MRFIAVRETSISKPGMYKDMNFTRTKVIPQCLGAAQTGLAHDDRRPKADVFMRRGKMLRMISLLHKTRGCVGIYFL